MLRVPGVTLTTRHSAAVYPWALAQRLPTEGAPIGINTFAGGVPFCYDPWVCYAAGVISSPNMVVAGQLGRGKSALVKTYLHRQLDRGRQAFVLDPKGEYSPLADATGMTIIRLRPGGTARLNPLDPPADAPTSAEVGAARAAALSALAVAGTGGPLFPEQSAALATVAAQLPATAVLADVVDALLSPTGEVAAALSTTPASLAAVVRPVAMALHRLLIGDLAGMLDAPTSARVSPQGAGIVVDLSAVAGTPALAPVMVAAGSWLRAVVTARSDVRKLLLVDEAWALLAHPPTTAWLQQTSKLARAHGVQLITVVHRASDLAAQADVGTAAHAQAQGLLTDAETRVVYGQAPGERRDIQRLLDLTDAETDLVASMPPYRALWKVGGHTAVVDHLLAPGDGFVDTNQAMRP